MPREKSPINRGDSPLRDNAFDRFNFIGLIRKTDVTSSFVT